MQRQKLISKLLATNAAKERSTLIRQNAAIIDIGFARSLKDSFYSSWTTAPQKTLNAASALEQIAKVISDDEARALASWVRGIADLTSGKLEKAVADLDKAASLFVKIGEEHSSAQTQVAKLIALALLGRYDESIKTGKRALKTFAKYNDELAAGKVEKNLGNIVARQGKELAAKEYYLAARRRFVGINNKSELAMCDNSLANTFAELNDFANAEKFYGQALESARTAKMLVTEAEIEASLGNLAFFRGRFAEALQYLELSRQKYNELKMQHQRAIADLEIADIYLELNLSDEAFSIYQNVARVFKSLGLRGEEARAREKFGRAALVRNEPAKAKRQFALSAQLYILERNPTGAAGVRLAEASLDIQQGDFEAALSIILDTKRLLAKSENPRQRLLAKWLHGEILRNLKKLAQAERMLAETYNEAVYTEQLNLAQICLNSLGNLALQTNDVGSAKRHFLKAVDLVELLRAPLAAEEFRMSFMVDKLAPFESLAKIYIAENDLVSALMLVEMVKARTLSEMMNDALPEQNAASSPKTEKQISTLREELNWYYSRLSRDPSAGSDGLNYEIRTREKQLSDIIRQTGSISGVSTKHHASKPQNDLSVIQAALGKHKALIEFTSFEGKIAAFVVTGENIDHVAHLVDIETIHILLRGLRFQFESLRFGKDHLRAFMPELKDRADQYLKKLYQNLIRPLEKYIGIRDLVVVPSGVLHYVPFCSLYDGNRYIVETREIVSSPSATIWSSLSAKPKSKLRNALLIGYADERIPLVNEEIAALQKIFGKSKILTGSTATFGNYTRYAAKYDILHIACHGQFRPDNPMFSSLHLADGFVTVGDICAQRLKAAVVTLSACETGLNKISAGEEIIGLARGFLTAGAASLILSLWTVNDEATSRLMLEFYQCLQRGETVAASLRQAQQTFIDAGEHQYFWSPFTAIGK